MCVSNESVRLSESSRSPDSPSQSNAEVTNCQIALSLMSHCPPLKEQPVNIPTSSMTLLSSTQTVPTLAPTAAEQKNEDW